MEQSKKIAIMDAYYERVKSDVSAMEEALDKSEASLSGLVELMEYYGSEEWFEDVEDYQSGKLPKDFGQGVLEENSVFNMCMKYRDVAIRMLELGTLVIKKYGM